MLLRWWAILCEIDQVSQGAGFDIRQLLAGALGVNMTVNKLKEGEQPVIEAEELASKEGNNAIHQEVSENCFSGTFVLRSNDLYDLLPLWRRREGTFCFLLRRKNGRIKANYKEGVSHD